MLGILPNMGPLNAKKKGCKNTLLNAGVTKNCNIPYKNSSYQLKRLNGFWTRVCPTLWVVMSAQLVKTRACTFIR